MSRALIVATVLALCGVSLSAQNAPNGESPAPIVILPAEQQIVAAVLPLPKELRESATVMGYAPNGAFGTLRRGAGEMICLASDPKLPRFHVACYHRLMEPFMARGRALRAQGVKGDQVDSVRFREVREGKLHVPRAPTTLYSLTGAKDAFDAGTGTVTKARSLFVVYIPFATAASTGLSAVPVEGAPWVMFPGTPKAHIMFVPKM
jgi:hypothetical protein